MSKTNRRTLQYPGRNKRGCTYGKQLFVCCSRKEEFDMPTWMIFIGAEAITVIITVIWILCFMRGGDKEDEYDRRLKELTAITEARRTKTYAEREEHAE